MMYADMMNLKPGDYVEDIQFDPFLVLGYASVQDANEVVESADQHWVDTKYDGVYAQINIEYEGKNGTGQRGVLYCSPDRYFTVLTSVVLAQ